MWFLHVSPCLALPKPQGWRNDLNMLLSCFREKMPAPSHTPLLPKGLWHRGTRNYGYVQTSVLIGQLSSHPTRVRAFFVAFLLFLRRTDDQRSLRRRRHVQLDGRSVTSHVSEIQRQIGKASQFGSIWLAKNGTNKRVETLFVEPLNGPRHEDREYRVTLVVEYLGWDDYHFGHSTASRAVSAWQRGAWQDWLGSCARWWNIQINVNPT